MPFLVGVVTPQDYGAVGNGIADDTSAINQALAAVFAAGGGYVYLPVGQYLVSSTISIPPYTFLVGVTEISLNLFATPGTISRIVASASWAPSSSTGIVSIMSKTPGGWSVNTASCGLTNVFIDGSLNASTNLQGLNLVGPVYDVHLNNVFIWKAPHNGITASGQTESGISPTFPYHQRYTRVTIANCGNTGFSITNFTDSTFDNCMGFANTGNNWTMQNNSNSVLTSCRAEWSSGGRGFDITGSSGSVVFNNCTTDQNTSEGLRIHATSQQTNQGGGIVVTGGKFHADGNGGTNNNGIKITGNGGVPVLITGVNVEIGQNSSVNYPNVALEIDTSSNVTVDGCVLQGITTSWSDGGGNTNVVRKGVIGQVGAQGSQTTTLLQDLPYGVPQVQSSTTTVANTATETVLQTYTVPANEPIAGSVYHVTGYGTYSTTGTPTLQFTVRWGGVAGTITAQVPAITTPSGVTNALFWYDGMLTFQSATTVFAAFNLEFGTSTTTDQATSYIASTSTATTVTTSSASALVVTAKWGTASASNTISINGGCVRKLA